MVYVILAVSFAISSLFTIYRRVLLDTDYAMELIDIEYKKPVIDLVRDIIIWLVVITVIFPVAFIASFGDLKENLTKKEIENRLKDYYANGGE